MLRTCMTETTHAGVASQNRYNDGGVLLIMEIIDLLSKSIICSFSAVKTYEGVKYSKAIIKLADICNRHYTAKCSQYHNLVWQIFALV